jgi:exopolysaccharide production protein ExoZ
MLIGAQAWPRLLMLGVPAALIVWGTLQLKSQESTFTYLGDASYALYLVHAPIAAATVLILARFAKLPPDVAIAAAMFASVIMAWRIHELFEKPILAWLRRPRRLAPQTQLAE